MNRKENHQKARRTEAELRPPQGHPDPHPGEARLRLLHVHHALPLWVHELVIRSQPWRRRLRLSRLTTRKPGNSMTTPGALPGDRLEE